MRCKNCDYRLWNLRSRTCPECGTPFKPSDFEFAINSVQFCCPHCSQDYYGTGEKGHLRPFEFNCVRCRTRISMDDMVCLPTTGVEEDQTQLDRMPWLDQTRSGWRRWIGTIGMALVRPGELLRATPVKSSLTRAWAFFFVTYSVTIVVASSIFCIFPVIIALGAPKGSTSAAGFLGGFFGGISFGLLFVAIGTLVGVLLWALIAHGLLRISGATAHGFRRTQQAVLYASGANIITGIPCFGAYFGWIWWLVSSVIALKEGQNVSGLRATFAILGFPALCIVAAVAFYALVLYMVLTAGPTATAWFPGQFGVTLPITTAITAYAGANNGVGPIHPAELLTTDTTLSPLDFVVSGGTPPETVWIGGTTLDLYESLDEKQQLKAIGAAVASAPATRAPHRFGDFIFVYAGLNLSTCPRDTWIVIHEPVAGAAAGGTALGGWYDVGLAGGTTIPVAGATFPAMLAAENVKRQSLGAPPIPATLFVATSQTVTSQPADSTGDEP